MDDTNDGAPPLGFDHKDGPAKIPKSKSNSSSRVKAAHVVGRTLDELSYDTKTKLYRQQRNDKNSVMKEN